MNSLKLGLLLFAHLLLNATSVCDEQSLLNCFNSLTYSGLADDSITCNCTELAVNCSYRNLSTVPSEDFQPSITQLYLQHNRITNLPNKTFERYTDLTLLNLASNSICFLNSDSFYGLKNLIFLNLHHNQLVMKSSNFPSNVFRPITSLETLLIYKNHNNVAESGLDYPDQAFSVLTNLQELHLDGLYNKSCGPGFNKMVSLRKLTFSGSKGTCNMFELSSDTFQHVANIMYLDISYCNISGTLLKAGAFSSFTNLNILNISYNLLLGIDGLKKIFYDLKDLVSLEELNIRHVLNTNAMGTCLLYDHVENFPKYLKVLSAQENNIVAYGSGVIESLSTNLTKLDLSGNSFIFEQYLQDLMKLKHLKTLILNGVFYRGLPQSYPNDKKITNDMCDISRNYSEVNESFSFPLPPNLETLELNRAELAYLLTRFFVTTNVLKNLTISNNSFPRLVGPITGLTSLEHLDISFSHVEYISVSFFDSLQKLKFLNLSNNLLGLYINKLTSENARVFSSLIYLQILDLSSNFISDFDYDFLRNLTSLQYLIMDNNPLVRFPVDISLMTGLKVLNLRYTRLTTLNENVRNSIDHLISRNVSITIDMRHTPIACNCENYDFFLWMIQSKAFDHDFQDYLCVYEDDYGITIIDGYVNQKVLLSRQCADRTWMICTIMFSTIVSLLAVLLSVVYRFRWKIRYLYNAAYLQFTGDGRDSGDFIYDAFLSYDQEDFFFVKNTLVPQLESRGLKLCIHATDFTAGEFISSNIVRAVSSSRRTIVVLTRNLLASYWCNFEIQMANMEALHTGRRVLIFLLVEKIPSQDLGVELLYYIRSNTYISMSDISEGANCKSWLWDKVVKDIRE